ncbi:ABC transporter ATP-binding protein [Streptomyces sp. NPDC046759]|uniref:ABC transporter ATP-binding protein n=1 Tax=Streptomyces sp. NPDC046759 TaxID=3155019 RepID=UPI0033E54910
MAIVDVQDLGRVFTSRRGAGTTALEGVTFSIGEGEVLGLLGPNGAGKTTLSRILTTLLLPTSGTARIGGHDVVRRPKEVRRLIGLVLGGDRGLYGRLTARQNLLYWGALQGLGGKQARRRTDEMLERFGLGARADDRVELFSRGMVQRVHLARALLSSPPLLIMDEPTNGMDPHAGAGFRQLVHELKDAGCTVVLTTHDMHEAQDVCTRIALIDHGRILNIGAADELLARIGAPRTIRAQGVRAEVAARIAELPGTVEVTEQGSLTARLDGPQAQSAALALLLEAGATEIAVAPPGLTELYRTVITDREFAL